MPENTTAEVINDLANDITEIAVGKGFWDYGIEPNYLIPLKLVLIDSEIAEALEVHREDFTIEDDEVLLNVNTDMTEPQEERFTEELADAVIRILDISGYYGLDIGEAIISKIEKNRNRPFKHNKRY